MTKKILTSLLFIILLLFPFISYSLAHQTAQIKSKNRNHNNINSIKNMNTMKNIKKTSTRTVVIYIIGLAGTGKYTIAKKISQYGYKIVDNHLINNTIFSLLGDNAATKASQSATEKIGRIRNIVLEFVVHDYKSNYVFTNQLLENDYHYGIYNKMKATADNRGSLFVPVVLNISKEQRAKRIVQKDRAKLFKITDVNEAYRNHKMLKIPHENLLELNVSDLSADEAARQIIRHVNTLR